MYVDVCMCGCLLVFLLLTYRVLLTMFNNLNAAGGVARSVKQRDSAHVGHVVFAPLEAPVERTVGQVVVYGRLIDGHLANAVRRRIN